MKSISDVDGFTTFSRCEKTTLNREMFMAINIDLAGLDLGIIRAVLVAMALVDLGILHILLYCFRP